MSCCVDSLYICVDDMDRAVQFYEDLIEQKVTEKGNIGSRFEIDDFRFNLFAYNEVKEKHTFGNAHIVFLYYSYYLKCVIIKSP